MSKVFSTFADNLYRDTRGLKMYTLKIEDYDKFDSKKVAVIKLIRQYFGMSLFDGKYCVDSLVKMGYTVINGNISNIDYYRLSEDLKQIGITMASGSIENLNGLKLNIFKEVETLVIKCITEGNIKLAIGLLSVIDANKD